MASFNYDRAAQAALRLLEKFGREISIGRTLPGEPDPQEPWVPVSPTQIAYQAVAAVLPASKGTIQAFDNRIERGTLTEERLRYVIMSSQLVRTSETGPESIEPRSMDTVWFDGHAWTVLGCTPLNPAGVPVIYPMGVKR